MRSRRKVRGVGKFESAQAARRPPMFWGIPDEEFIRAFEEYERGVSPTRLAYLLNMKKRPRATPFRAGNLLAEWVRLGFIPEIGHWGVLKRRIERILRDLGKETGVPVWLVNYAILARAGALSADFRGADVMSILAEQKIDPTALQARAKRLVGITSRPPPLAPAYRPGPELSQRLRGMKEEKRARLAREGAQGATHDEDDREPSDEC